MIIPKKIKIGGHIWKVDLKELTGKMGECDYANLIITLDKRAVRTQLEVTFLHELLHAINCEFDLSHDGHRVLEATAQQLYQIFKDNRMFNEKITTKKRIKATNK